MMHALVLILTWDAMPPPPLRYATLDDCRRAAPAVLLHMEITGRPVAWSACQPVRPSRNGDGEVVVR